MRFFGHSSARVGRGWRGVARSLGGVSLLGLLLLLAACGGASSAASNYNPHSASSAGSGGAPSSSSNGAAGGAQQKYVAATPNARDAGASQYLSKSLSVAVAVDNTRRAAQEIETWIMATDPRATTVGQDYQQGENSDYTVTISFEVQATIYPQVVQYLAGYAAQRNGKLVNLHENVQDLSNDYVDTQARLTNLHTEQDRLRTLLSQAQSLQDLLVIEDKLSNIEGQIEQIQAHLNALNSQVTYYTVTVTTQPISSASPAPQGNWNPGTIFGSAVLAALAFGQGLATVVIWLAVFSVYVAPVVVVVVLVRRWRRRRGGMALAAAGNAAGNVGMDAGGMGAPPAP